MSEATSNRRRISGGKTADSAWLPQWMLDMISQGAGAATSAIAIQTPPSGPNRRLATATHARSVASAHRSAPVFIVNTPRPKTAASGTSTKEATSVPPSKSWYW